MGATSLRGFELGLCVCVAQVSARTHAPTHPTQLSCVQFQLNTVGGVAMDSDVPVVTSSDDDVPLPIVTGDMVEEEKRLAEERAKQESAEMEEALANQAAMKLEVTAFSKLDDLLSKTQIYSQFLLEKMDDIAMVGKSNSPCELHVFCIFAKTVFYTSTGFSCSSPRLLVTWFLWMVRFQDKRMHQRRRPSKTRSQAKGTSENLQFRKLLLVGYDCPFSMRDFCLGFCAIFLLVRRWEVEERILYKNAILNRF